MDAQGQNGRGRTGFADIRLRSLALPYIAFGSTPEYQEKFVWLGVLLVFAVVLLLVWHAGKKHLARTAAVRDKRTAMTELFQRQMEQRARMDMFPHQRVGNKKANMFSGICTGCDDHLLRFDFTLKPGMEAWPHVVVDIFFREQTEDDVNFYAFTATIQEQSLNGSRLQIRVPLPLELRRDQKRAFFRVTPQPQFIPALALWPVDPEHVWLSELNGRTLGKPVFGYRPGKVSQVILEDLSAGGARLGLEPHYFASLGARYQVGDTFILLAVLGNKAGQVEKQFWLNCVCVHRDASLGRSDPVLGLKFQAWCLTERLTQNIAWELPEEGGEVLPLHEWLMRYVRERQLEKRAAAAEGQ